MADTKITALAAITTVDPAADVLPIVDISDTSMAASGTTKKITTNQILGSGGTATLASATITGDLTVDTSTLKVNSSTNRVGILTASPESELDVRGLIAVRGTPTFPTTGVGPELFWSPGNSNSNLYSYNRGTSAWAEMAYGALNHTFQISGVTAMTLNASGNLVFPSAKGIDFSAVTGGTGTATGNVLNDYEEGTFTPTVIGATTAGVGVYTTQVGRYTKIGNLVTVQVYLGWSAHTGTGNMRFGNFPFNTSSDSGSNNGVSFGYVNNIALSASNVLTGLTGIGNSYVDAYQYPVGGGASTAVPIDTAGDVIFTASYRV